MKTKCETFARGLLAKGLGAFVFFGTLLLPLHASANQCDAIQCDCDTLLQASDHALCLKQQAELRKDCNLAGSHTGYCRVAGLKAYPLPFSIDSSLDLIARSKDIEASLAQREALNWSAEQDLATAVKYQSRSAYGNALTAYKNLAATLDKLYALQRQAVDSFIAKDDAGEAEDVAGDAWEPLSEWSDKLYVQARGLWADKPESDPKLQRKRQVLAMNVMRYASSATQQAAEMAALADEPEDAATLWRKAAENAELMLGWRKQTRSKAQYINYFQQQGIAAWHRAAMYYDQLEEPELAAESRLKADQLAKTDVASRS
ncbi:hypothetical protein [Simiduia agarivorans]|uniref:Uncharacterized protein n=1 Tax=Simiduia agarivorans (strain DSM 21679 / JCM 13881 / BCRC 17597 / SA1) TaxID=1117647 RepID=K4KH81_SIMAS|nr:hypothetical protein [Simiduia agarivorans]AFU97560.2 hypothetical protein M5M_01675 [Simiduia agarivorans SA1 = DSM 21679]